MHRLPLASGSERSSELRDKYLRISVPIYDNAIYVLNVLADDTKLMSFKLFTNDTCSLTP